MAINRFKVPLNNARMPLVSTKAQRAVMVPSMDAAPRTPRIFMGADESIDYGLPQIVYAENVMPSAEGIRSVGYLPIIAASTADDFDQIFALRDADENTVLYSPSHGKNYIYDKAAGAWSSRTFADIFGSGVDTTSPNTPATARVSYAYVDGKTFVCYSRLIRTDTAPAEPADASIMVWNPATKQLDPAGALIANLDIPIGQIDGISSSNGYLLVYSGLTIYWAPFSGTAFDFSIYANGAFTGAGFQIPEDIQAPITAVTSLPGGFVMFTSKNAIAANYHSQTISAPWAFRAIPDGGGVESYEQVTVEGSRGAVVAYTTTGVQRISLNSSEEVFPDLSDFIAGRHIERYDFGLQTLRQGSTSIDFYVKLSNIANRYTVFSYGTYPGVYSFALVYDIALKRWGKLRLVHRDCFYYSFGVQTGDMTYSMLGDVTYADMGTLTYDSTTQQSNAIVAAQHGLAFLKRTGEVVLADWGMNVRATEDEAVAVIGRIQLSRSANVQLNRVEAEGLSSGRLAIQPSYNGRDLQATEQLVVIESGPDYLLAGGMIDCKNFNVIVEGTFNLSTLILEASATGRA